MKKLNNKVAIITGGANGIGKATVQKFLEEGAEVAIWDINKTAGENTVLEFEKVGGKCQFYEVNTTDIQSVSAAADLVKNDFGRINILVNNAGITRDASMKKMTSEQWQQVIDVNLTGVFNCTKIIAPFMIENRWGRIISASSVVAHNGNFGQANYVAAKAGVIGMTKVWAKEFGSKGITANAVAPGFINTEMVKTIPAEFISIIQARTPLNRLGEPIDIANAYAFLASEEASFITGTVLNVDGGMVV